MISMSAPVPLGLKPDFFDRLVKGAILDLSCSLILLWDPSFMLKSYRVGGSQCLCGGLQDFSVSPSPLLGFLGLGTKGIGNLLIFWDWGLKGLGTRA